MQMCINYGQFKKIMLKKGYIINDDYNRKYPTIRSINDKKAVRMYHLGEQYLPKNIANKVEHNPYYYQNRYMEFIHPKKKKQKYRVYKYKGKFKDISKMSGIDVLFLLLFHLLGLLPKRDNYQPLSPEMKQEVRKMERYYNEIRVIVTEKLKTIEDVKRTLEVLKQLEAYEVSICRYINSEYVDSSCYEQLSPEKIQEHTRIYSKVLQKRNVNTRIVGHGYIYN